MRKDGVTSPGDIIQISNEGMPVRGRSKVFGHLFIKFRIVFPKVRAWRAGLQRLCFFSQGVSRVSKLYATERYDFS